MKIKNWVLFTVLSVLTLGCSTPSSTTQATTNREQSEIASASPETSPESAKSTDKATDKSGSFVSGEHSTQGTAQIVKKDGQVVLELDQAFQTSEGPDLVVALHRSDDVIGSTKPPAHALKEGDYVVLAPLKKVSGAQRYEVPETVKLADYKSVVIWCQKFNATFGAAGLGK